MFRKIFQIAIFVIICLLYSIFVFEKKLELANLILASNLVSFFIVVSFVIEVKTNNLLSKEYFKTFSLSHINLVFKRITLFFKRYHLWKIIILPPMLLLLVETLDMVDKIIYFATSILQNLITVYILFTLIDFLNLKGQTKQIYILPAILSSLIIFTKGTIYSDMVVYNIFGGIVYSPLFHENNFLILLISALIILLYSLNKFYLHNKWEDN